MKHILILTLVAAIAPSLSGSAARAASGPAAPRIQLQDGLPILLTWPDGRVAQLMAGQTPAPVIPAAAEVNDNTCTSFRKATCRIRAAIRADVLSLQWKVHPDTKKVGKELKLVPPTGDKINGSFLQLVMSGYRKLRPKAVGDFPFDELECDDYRWLPGGSLKRAPDTLHIIRWEAETMSANPETGLNENRSFGGAVGLTWTAGPDGRIVFSDPGYYTGTDLIPIPTLYLGNIAALAVRSSDGAVCQASLKMNQGDFMRGIQSAFGNSGNNLPYQPYVAGSNEYTQIIRSSLHSLFEGASVYAVE